MARIGCRRSATVTEVPGARCDRAVAVGGGVGEAGHERARGEAEVRRWRIVACDRVASGQRNPGEAGVGLDPDVVGADLGGRDRAGFRVAVAVRAAVVARIGRRTAELHVQVGIAGAAGDDEVQAGRAGRHVHRVVDVVTGGGGQAAHGDAVDQHVAAAADRDRLGHRVAGAAVVGNRQGHAVGARTGVGVARVGRGRSGAVTEVPRARRDRTIAVGRGIGEARHQAAGREAEVGDRRVVAGGGTGEVLATDVGPAHGHAAAGRRERIATEARRQGVAAVGQAGQGIGAARVGRRADRAGADGDP